MVLTKESDFYKILNEVANSVSKTKSVNTEVQYVNFIKDKGIYLYLQNLSNKFFISDKSVDFNATISSAMFIPLVLKEFENGKIELKLIDNYIYVGSNKIDCLRDKPDLEEIVEHQPNIEFTSEEFKKLDKDFLFTLNNYYTDSSLEDVILIGILDGEIYELSAGEYGSKFSRFNATIDDANIQQIFGHDKFTVAIPHAFYNIIKDFDKNVKISLMYDQSGNCRIIMETGNICFSFFPKEFGIDLLTQQVAWYSNITDGIPISDFKEVINLADTLSKYNFKSMEDFEIFVSIKDKKMVIEAEELKFIYDVKTDKNLRIGINSVNAFSFIAKQLSDDAIVSKLDNVTDRILIKDKDSLYTIYDSAQDYYTE